MKTISDFKWIEHAPNVSWSCCGNPVSRTYHFPIRSAIVLNDATGVAIVEPVEEFGHNNAAVFNCDGNERFRLILPSSEFIGNSFDQIYYLQGKLTAFLNIRGTDFRCEVDELTGNLGKVIESR